jgi:hypothetical protein
VETQTPGFGPGLFCNKVRITLIENLIAMSAWGQFSTDPAAIACRLMSAWPQLIA